MNYKKAKKQIQDGFSQAGKEYELIHINDFNKCVAFGNEDECLIFRYAQDRPKCILELRQTYDSTIRMRNHAARILIDAEPTRI